MRKPGNTRYREELTVPELASKYRIPFYDLILEAVTETIATQGVQAFQKTEPKSYNLVSFEMYEREFSISIMRASVFGFLKRGIEYFESTEQYEKCEIFMDLVNQFNDVGIS